MFLKRRFHLSALSETKLKGRGEIMFGEVVRIHWVHFQQNFGLRLFVNT